MTTWLTEREVSWAGLVGLGDTQIPAPSILLLFVIFRDKVGQAGSPL